MRTIRNTMILGGLLLGILAIGSTGAKAQMAGPADFAGTFTLPHDAQWGRMFLPAGEYTLYYGQLTIGGVHAVKIVGKEKGSPSGYVVSLPAVHSTASKNALVCIREGDGLIVRALNISELGESVGFMMPRNLKLVANRQVHGKYILAEGPSLIQQIAITPSGK